MPSLKSKLPLVSTTVGRQAMVARLVCVSYPFVGILWRGRELDGN